MALPGSAFLALWNDRAESREDYEAWHSREHLPERLGISGILSARRYVSGQGPLPPYFTLYSLSDLEVLDSTEYREIVNRPTSWSLSMRPSLSQMYRQGCATQLSLGAGIAGNLAVAVLREKAHGHDLGPYATIADNASVSALHLGVVKPITPLTFENRLSSDLPTGDAILLVEMFDTEGSETSLRSFDRMIEASGYERALDWSMYRLAFALRSDDALHALPADTGQSAINGLALEAESSE